MTLEYDDSERGEQYDEHDFGGNAVAQTSAYKRPHDAVDHNGGHEDGGVQEGEDATNVSQDGESSTSSDASVPKKRRRKEFLNLNATFMAGVQGVTLLTDQVILASATLVHTHTIRFDIWLGILIFRPIACL